MEVQTASTADGSLLRAVRTTLDHADEVLMCVAFASEQGVHLLRRQFDRLGQNARLVATTTFGSTTPGALSMANGLGVRVQTLNPGSGTFHPKAFLARRHDRSAAALVGSCNLTRGLIANVEIGTVLRGTLDDAPLADVWRWAEHIWDDPRAEVWTPPAAGEVIGKPTFEPELLALLQAEVARDPLFLTLTRGNPNRVTEVTPTGIYIETDASRAKGTPPQEVPSWMFELAWETLRSRGRVTQQEVLNELNIKRSAAVCAILARLPGVGLGRKLGGTSLLWELRAFGQGGG